VRGGGGGAPRPGSRPLSTRDPALRGANITDPQKVNALRDAMGARGFVAGQNPIVVLETNLYGNRTIKLVVDGNHRLLAARAAKLPSVPVEWISEKEFFALCERAGLNPLTIIQQSLAL